MNARRSAAVPLGLTSLLATSLTGCGADQPSYGAVCVDQATQQRITDDRCDSNGSSGGGGAGWYYLNSGSRYPAIGSRVANGSYSAPGGGQKVDRGLSSTGGSISKGGFGARGGGGG